MKRALLIIGRAIMGVTSPSLDRKVKISDIWKTPNYEGVSGKVESPKIFFLCDNRQDIKHAKNFKNINGNFWEVE